MQGEQSDERGWPHRDHAVTPRDVVVITFPPSAYLSVLRTATAGLAARLDFTIDEIEDLRIAVDEACAMLLPQARARRRDHLRVPARRRTR